MQPKPAAGQRLIGPSCRSTPDRRNPRRPSHPGTGSGHLRSACFFQPCSSRFVLFSKPFAFGKRQGIGIVLGNIRADHGVVELHCKHRDKRDEAAAGATHAGAGAGGVRVCGWDMLYESQRCFYVTRKMKLAIRIAHE